MPKHELNKDETNRYAKEDGKAHKTSTPHKGNCIKAILQTTKDAQTGRNWDENTNVLFHVCVCVTVEKSGYEFEREKERFVGF